MRNKLLTASATALPLAHPLAWADKPQPGSDSSNGILDIGGRFTPPPATRPATSGTATCGTSERQSPLQPETEKWTFDIRPPTSAIATSGTTWTSTAGGSGFPSFDQTPINYAYAKTPL